MLNPDNLVSEAWLMEKYAQGSKNPKRLIQDKLRDMEKNTEAKKYIRYIGCRTVDKYAFDAFVQWQMKCKNMARKPPFEYSAEKSTCGNRR